MQMSDVWSPPQAPLDTPNSADDAYAIDIRQRHVNHETSVKSVGTLYYFVSAILLLVATSLILGGHFSLTQNAIIAVILIGFAVPLAFLGRGLKQLKSWSKIPAGVLSGIGLLGFPIWTLINGYILYLLFSDKGTMVFSSEYKQIIADTPDIKSRTPIVVWILIAVLVTVGVLAFIGMANRH
jgi:hypothetical protein